MVFAAAGSQTYVSDAYKRDCGSYVVKAVVTSPNAMASQASWTVMQAQATAVIVTTPPVVHGFCGGPNATNFTVTITTNGPVTIQWHFEIYTSGGTWLNSTTDQPMVFAAAGSQSYVSDAYKRDCGSYVVKAVVTSPNSVTGQAGWTVVQP